MTSAYAPFNPSYSQTNPYLTTTEYQNAPTAIDLSNLIASGGSTAQTTALGEVIGRASSIIDNYCLGAWGTLNATLNTENARVWGNNYGQFIVHPKYWPILEVQSFQYNNIPITSSNPGASVTPYSSISIEPTQFIVQPSGVVGLGLNQLAGIVPRNQYFCQWTYVNGWANTTLSASVAAGAASVTPVNVLGLYPGSDFMLFDAPNDESATVASNYVPGGAVVPLTASLTYSHQAGIVVSNLPKSVKQAAIALTTALIKSRGSGALIAADIGEITHVAGGIPQHGDADIAEAMTWLDPMRQIFVGY